MISENKDKEFVLESVKENGRTLQFASEELKNDKEVVLEAVKQNGYSLRYASEELKNDKKFVLEAVKRNVYSLKYAGEKLKNDKEVVLEAVKEDGYSLKYASVELKNEKEVVIEAVKQDGINLKYASAELKNDIEVVIEAVKQNGIYLKHVSEKLKNDKEIVFVAVKQNGYFLQYAGEELRNDKEFVLEAVKRNVYSLKYAGEKLKNDREVVLEAVKRNVLSLRYASEELKNDVDFMTTCCKISRKSIHNIGSNLVKDSLLAEKMRMYGTDVERAFEEFERERKDNFQKLRNSEGIWIKLCYYLLKKKWEIVDIINELVRSGTILKEILKEKGYIGGLKYLEKKYLKNEQSLFERIQKWKNEVDSLKFTSSENRNVFFIQFSKSSAVENTNMQGERICFDKKHFKDLEIFRVLGIGGYGRTYLCVIDGCYGLFVVKLYKGRFFGTLSVEREKRFLKRDHLQIPPHENVVPVLYHSDSEMVDLTKLPDFEEFWKYCVPKDYQKELGESQSVRHGGMVIMKYHQTTLSSVIIYRTLSNLNGGDEILLPSEVVLIMKGIFSGAFHLFQNKIVHRDLHCGNIFIHLNMGRVWIGDYGCSLDLRKNPSGFRVHEDEDILYSFSEGLKFSNKKGGGHCSPEILNFDRSKSDILDYSKSDLYSCGLIAKELYDLVNEEKKDKKSIDFWGKSESFIHFIETMILVDFEKRICFDEAVKKIEKFVDEDDDSSSSDSEESEGEDD